MRTAEQCLCQPLLCVCVSRAGARRTSRRSRASAVPLFCAAGSAAGAPGELRRRYCGDACRASCAAIDARTDPLLPALPGIAQKADCDVGLLRIVLELDALRSLEDGVQTPAADGSATAPSDKAAAPAAAGGQPDGDAAVAGDGAANGGDGGDAADAEAQRQVPTMHCGAADVDALLSHWDRTPAAWRDSVSAACT